MRVLFMPGVDGFFKFKGERTEKSFEEDKMKGKYPWFFSFEASKPAKKDS
ncbi:MAG: hypothetical protein K2I44_12225 [Muribaculaceae bacterium]|nr:hypothetical protein [Muribaculaceae bacterium]